MNKYLDIDSLLNSDFYKKNHRLSWHTSHKEYGKLTSDLYKLLFNLKFTEHNNTIFEVSKTYIYSNLSAYLSHVHDYVILTKNKIQPEYSRKGSIYVDYIWKKKSLSNFFELNQVHFNKILKKKSILKKIYSKFAEYIPKFFFKFIVVSKNNLIRDFLINNRFKYLTILTTNYNFSKKLQSNIIKILSNKISLLIISMIEKNHFNLTNEQKKSISFIIESNLIKIDNDFKNYNGFLKNSKNIILGTETGSYSRFISTVTKKHGAKVWKFEHGGERCFFDDDSYWNAAFYNTDVFITYGKKWRDYVIEKAKEFDKNIEIKVIQSNYYKKIFDKYFGTKSKSLKKILYIPNSFVSEARQFPFQDIKIIDPMLYDWQRYLIKFLKSNGYEVIYKIHPKGNSKLSDSLAKISSDRSSEPMINALKNIDKVICDRASTAFVESMCAGKDVIYIDFKLRQFNKTNFNDFNSVVKIINGSEHDGRFSIDEEELLSALVSPQKNINLQKKLVKEYWLHGDDDES